MTTEQTMTRYKGLAGGGRLAFVCALAVGAAACSDATIGDDVVTRSELVTGCAYVGNGTAGIKGVNYSVKVDQQGTPHLNNPIYMEYWGTFGVSSSTLAIRNIFGKNATLLLNSIGFWNRLAEYGNPHGAFGHAILATHPSSSGATFSDSTVSNDLTNELNAGTVGYDPDGIYVVVVGPENTVPGHGPGGGYNNSFSYRGKPLRYAVLHGTNTEVSTELLDHEVSEAVTQAYSDPAINAVTNGESQIGDYCNGVPATLAGISAQKEWSQASCGCVAVNGSYTPLQFNNGTNERYADIDWEVGQFKSECAAGDQVVGLSGSTSTAVAHDALCGKQGGVADVNQMRTVDFVNTNGGFSGWDWDVGKVKGQCGQDEDIVGVSQLPTGKLGALRCAIDKTWASPIAQTSCTVHAWDGAHNSEGNTDSGDWDPGSFKLDCDASSQVMKGVSHDANGHVHAILCCNGVRKQWAWGGSFQLDDCSGVNNRANPITGSTTCPAGYTAYRSTRQLDPETLCGGFDYFCAKEVPPGLSEGTSWISMFQVDDCGVNNVGPGCPTNSTAVKLERVMAPESLCGAEQYACQSIFSNVGHFAGTYQIDDCGSGSTVNPLSGTLGCPAGYQASQYGRVLTAESRCGANQYICMN